MKRNNKKGFTIVELVIVIAVIAILSAVLIPTFGGITDKAKNSARDQEAKNAFTNYLIACDANPVNGKYILVKDDNANYYYVIDPSLAMSANIPFRYRLQSREGVVVDIVENARGFYVTAEFDEPEVDMGK